MLRIVRRFFDAAIGSLGSNCPALCNPALDRYSLPVKQEAASPSFSYECSMKKGGEPMDGRELKKFLAGFGIAGLLAGAGLVLSGNIFTAEAS